MDTVKFYAVTDWGASQHNFPKVHGVYLDQKSVEEARAGSVEAQQNILLMVANVSFRKGKRHVLLFLDWDHLTITELPAPRA